MVGGVVARDNNTGGEDSRSNANGHCTADLSYPTEAIASWPEAVVEG